MRWRVLPVLVLLCFEAHASTADWSDGPWKKKGKEHGVHVYAHRDSPIDVRAYRADMNLEFTPQQVWAVITDHDLAQRPSWVQKYIVLQETSTTRLVYQRIRRKGLGVRELTTQARLTVPSAPGGKYVYRWTLANAAGPHDEDIKDVNFFEGEMSVRKNPKGSRTRLSIRLSFDPNSWVPDFVLSKLVRKSTLELARGFRRELRARAAN